MQLRSVLIALALMLPLGAAAQTIIPSITYTADQPPVVVSGSSTISTNGNSVTVSTGASVTYQSTVSPAGIKLEPGFHAALGSNFYATVGPLLDSDGDGIPDVWERAYGLNPNSAADAAALDAAGDGLTNLQVYLAGGDPQVVAHLATASLPSGYQLVLLTPGNNVYGVNTSSWQIARLARP